MNSLTSNTQMVQFALFICFLIPERVVLSVPLILPLTQALLLNNPRNSYAQCKVHCTKYTAVLKPCYEQNGQISSTAKSQWQLFLLFFVWDCCWVFRVHVCVRACVRACVCVLGGVVVKNYFVVLVIAWLLIFFS